MPASSPRGFPHTLRSHQLAQLSLLNLCDLGALMPASQSNSRKDLPSVENPVWKWEIHLAFVCLVIFFAVVLILRFFGREPGIEVHDE